MQTATLLLTGLLTLLAARQATAQFQQYTPPGQFEETRESTQELLDRALQESRWRRGRFYFDPWLALRDIAYIDDVRGQTGGEKDSDFTGTVGFGIRAYRPIGSELTFAAHALPAYVWWLDLSERRRLNGRYGAGLFGNFGRTGIELTGARTEDAIFFSREVEVPVNTREDRGIIEFEIEAVGTLSFFIGGEERRIRYLDQDDPLLADLDLLDRDETILRAGLRFALTRGLSIGIGAEDSTVDFERAAGDRSNSGTAPILQLDFQGSKFFLDAELAYRDLEPRGGSAFIPYQEITGRFQASLRPAERFEPQLFGSRNLVYSVTQRHAYFEDTGFGVGLRANLGPWGSARVFVENGTNDYYAFATQQVDRRDDFTAVGGDLRFRIRRAEVTLGVTRTAYDSDFPGADRDVTVIRSSVNFGSGSTSAWY